MSSEAVLRVTALVNLAVEQAAAVQAAELELERAKANLTRTVREDLPELMKELTLTELKLDNGVEVVIEPDVECSITEANRERAHAWLRREGFGGLIKSVVSIAFGRDQEVERDRALEVLAEEFGEAGLTPEAKETVHPQTLKSFVKEQMALGKTPPTDLFGIFPFDKAKVKPHKAAPAERPARRRR